MFELWRKKRELAKLNKYYDSAIKGAKREKRSSDEIEGLITDLFGETYYIEEEIKILITRSFVRKAEALLLLVPPYDEIDMWEQGDMTNRWYLTPSGITKLRGLLREETAARRKAFLEWISPIVGIISAITGLLTIIFAMAQKNLLSNSSPVMRCGGMCE